MYAFASNGSLHAAVTSYQDFFEKSSAKVARNFSLWKKGF